MTLGTSCDLSVSWLVGPVHLSDRDALYDTDTLARIGPAPCGPITLSRTFHILPPVLFISPSPFYLVLCYLVISSVPFDSVRFRSLSFCMILCSARDR